VNIGASLVRHTTLLGGDDGDSHLITLDVGATVVQRTRLLDDDGETYLSYHNVDIGASLVRHTTLLIGNDGDSGLITLDIGASLVQRTTLLDDDGERYLRCHNAGIGASLGRHTTLLGVDGERYLSYHNVYWCIVGTAAWW
jgi:hypothetical protein